MEHIYIYLPPFKRDLETKSESCDAERAGLFLPVGGINSTSYLN